MEGHPSSMKFTIDLASHVIHSLLGTMFTVSFAVLIRFNKTQEIFPSYSSFKDSPSNRATSASVDRENFKGHVG